MKLAYIIHTEPINHFSGNEVRFFIREFDNETKKGKSGVFIKKIDYIIPTFEIKNNEVGDLFQKCKNEFPQIQFKQKYYNSNKSIIWAYINDLKSLNSRKKEERIKLPNKFLVHKTSRSQQLRFYYPPFTMVNVINNNMVLPAKQEKSMIDLESILEDKKCAIDIETIDYDTPNERISNVVLNFGNRSYIITTFNPPFNNFKNYKIISVSDVSLDKSTDEIKKRVTEIIQKEDPLFFYGFNIEFDQRKLRGLGKDNEYLPGIGKTGPIYKSVQGMKNMITKGRFTVDLYPYLFFYYNIFENNKLETHARMSGINFTKSLPYGVLAHRTKKGEQGSLDDMIEVLTYVVEDGNVTYQLGEKNIKKIILKSKFVKRKPSIICTTSGKNIMKEFWRQKFFLKKNTLQDRYEYSYKENKFSIEEYKKEFLNLDKKDGLFKNISIIYPTLFIKALWDTVIAGTADNLRFNTPEEKYDSYQTINEYVSQIIEDTNSFKEKSKNKSDLRNKLNYVLKDEYGVDMNTIETKLNEHSILFNDLLDKAELITYSKKFLYVKNPNQIVKRGLGFILAKGNCLSAGKKIVSLVENAHFPKFIYQGFNISKGKKTNFDIELMKDFLLRRLCLENENNTISFLKNKINKLRKGKVNNENLIYKGFFRKNEKEIGPGYGFVINNKEPLKTDDFLMTSQQPNYEIYISNFLKTFKDVITAGFDNKQELLDIFRI